MGLSRRSRRHRIGGRWKSRGGRHWRLRFALFAVVGTTLVLLAEGFRVRESATGILAWLVCSVLLVVSGGTFYLRYRIAAESALAWLTAVTMAVATLEFPLALLETTEGSGSFGPYDAEVHLVLLLTAVAMLVLAARGVALPDRVDPLALGIALGAVGAGVSLVRTTLMPATADAVAGAATPIMVALHVLVALSVAGLLLRITSIHLHYRLGSCVAVVALVSAYAALSTGLTAHPVARLGALALATSACSAIAFTSVAMLVAALREQGHELEALARRVARTESALLQDEERFHELRSTAAGIHATSGLLMSRELALPPAQRDRLLGMLDQELSRLERLLRRDAEWHWQPATIRLDDLIAPLVVAQQAQGTPVRWQPSGQTLTWDPDDATEVVSILLANAARHAPGSPVEITTTRLPESLQVEVRDSGPGVPDDLRERIFDRGVRSTDSSGRGLGLAVARHLLESHGGSLTLETTPHHTGARFVARFPAACTPEE